MTNCKRKSYTSWILVRESCFITLEDGEENRESYDFQTQANLWLETSYFTVWSPLLLCPGNQIIFTSSQTPTFLFCLWQLHKYTNTHRRKERWFVLVPTDSHRITICSALYELDNQLFLAHKKFNSNPPSFWKRGKVIHHSDLGGEWKVGRSDFRPRVRRASVQLGQSFFRGTSIASSVHGRRPSLRSWRLSRARGR